MNQVLKLVVMNRFQDSKYQSREIDPLRMREVNSVVKRDYAKAPIFIGTVEELSGSDTDAMSGNRCVSKMGKKKRNE